MPDHLRNGERVDVTLAIITSDHTEYTAQILLRIERGAIKPKYTKRKTGLFEAPADHKIESVVSDRVTPIADRAR